MRRHSNPAARAWRDADQLAPDRAVRQRQQHEQAHVLPGQRKPVLEALRVGSLAPPELLLSFGLEMSWESPVVGLGEGHESAACQAVGGCICRFEAHARSERETRAASGSSAAPGGVPC